MRIKTGHTVYELVVSADLDNNPISAATFSKAFFIDGSSTTAVTLSISLTDASRAIFSASFSASTFGFHQFELKNSLTDVIYISDSYDSRPDSEVDPSPTIYVGL
jgi:tellurite resistance protein TehA-like permease